MNIIHKVISTVTWFKACINASDDLRKACDLKLKQAISTRWNSVFYMLKRFLELRGVLTEIIYNYSSALDMVNVREIEILQDVMRILEPMEEATRHVFGEKYVTSILVTPLVSCLNETVDNLEPKTEMGKQLQQQLLNQMTGRFANREKSLLLAMARILVPRFKKVHLKDPLACSRAINHIRDLIKNDVEQREDEFTEVPQPANGKSSSLWNVHSRVVHEASQRKVALDESFSQGDELSVFLNAPVVNEKNKSLGRMLKTGCSVSKAGENIPKVPFYCCNKRSMRTVFFESRLLFK
ncbi:zinc finger BED domain-containing protein 4-like [Belonocnema kinseyi]|uniref:zinc finger BED domain-containing protein 4-like n=1 Tax=Belonocnema kinseyi TaxID=2817044 RepID=UPI00143DF8FF|nr:zinc finger BED domain-containing protein 4-like [Belonocnema kinseyi]